jgi:hypothetical protein
VSRSQIVAGKVAPYGEPPSDKDLGKLQGESLMGELLCLRVARQVSGRVAARVAPYVETPSDIVLGESQGEPLLVVLLGR